MDKILCIVTTDDTLLSESNLKKERQKLSDLIWGDNYHLSDLEIEKLIEIKFDKLLSILIGKSETVIPVYDNPHSDKENGQNETHYHIDSRYMSSIQSHIRIILPLKSNQRLEYRYLTKVVDIEVNSTPVEYIDRSKLKRKCIHKGKCPHRGFDLSNVEPDENGIITCPLHSLKFKNNKIL